MKTNRERAFTLLELLVVIAIIGILAAVAAPTLNTLKPDVMAAASQQLLGDLGRARQLAMANRTTVYMVFVPTNYYVPGGPYSRLTPEEQAKADKLLDKQLIGYNFVTLRSLGDQPGRPTPRYLSTWRTLPEGAMISPYKFLPRTPGLQPLRITNFTGQSSFEVFDAFPFAATNNIPFPSEQAAVSGGAPYAELPHIAFNYMGQLVSGKDEVIPLARGSVLSGRDSAKRPVPRPPSVLENPPGNSTNSSFNLLYVDWLTGRARVVRQEIR